MTGTGARILQELRLWKYRWLSTTRYHGTRPAIFQPVLWLGEGRIVLEAGVQFGWDTSSGFYTGYCHIEAVNEESVIEIREGSQINNNAVIKSEGAGIRIGPRALIGSGVVIYDSDFHPVDPEARRAGKPGAMAPVEIGEDAFIGDGVRILKGVTIGAHAVIGTGSVVTKSIPSGVVAAGNPARVVRRLESREAGRAAPADARQ